jgi:hypothetical protein
VFALGRHRKAFKLAQTLLLLMKGLITSEAPTKQKTLL